MKNSLTKPYTSFPLDDPLPGYTEREQWVPAILVQVAFGQKRTPRMPAIIDTGSPWCLFKSNVGTMAGIVDIKSGPKYDIGGIVAGVTEPVYFHRVKLYIDKEWVIEVTAGFADRLGQTAILGREGFFSNFVTTFDHSVNPPQFMIEKINRA